VIRDVAKTCKNDITIPHKPGIGLIEVCEKSLQNGEREADGKILSLKFENIGLNLLYTITII
jgi:hypothetical protein